MEAHKCPACDAWGKRDEFGVGKPDAQFICMACQGSGIVWRHDPANLPAEPAMSAAVKKGMQDSEQLRALGR